MNGIWMGYPQSNMPGKIPEDGGNLICDKCEKYIYIDI